METEHARTLEQMWAGEFGRQYTDRNPPSSEAGTVHHALCRRLGVASVLEMGCNQGLNLTRLDGDPEIITVGADISEYALRTARQRLPRVGLVRASAYDLPFAARAFDLVFTCGVLIHLPPAQLDNAIREIHRVSRRYIWCGEYHSDELVEVPYRGHTGALFKRDYGRRYQEQFADLRLCDRGFLGKVETGFDDITWWLFERA